MPAAPELPTPRSRTDANNDQVGDACQGRGGSGITCSAAPVGGCLAAAQAQIQVSEKTAGKERLKVQWEKFGALTTQGDFGDPVAGALGVADTQPTIQLVTSAGFCVGATMTEVTTDDGLQFRARKQYAGQGARRRRT